MNIPPTTIKPILLFSSRTGTLYNLTPSNYPKIQGYTGIHLSAGDFMHLKSTLAKIPHSNLTFKKFLGYKDDENILTYLAPYDYYKESCMNGCQGNKVKIMGNKGYQETKVEDYWELC